MVSCQESKSSADISTASPLLELILTGTWSSLTCWMSGNRRERASLALMATAAHSLRLVPSYCTIQVPLSRTGAMRRPIVSRGELVSRLLARLRLAGLARRLPSALGGRPELADAVLDAAGQHVQVGVRGKVTGDAERDLTAVGKDGDPGPDRRRDRHIRDDLQELAPGTVEQHLGPWHVGGDRDDLPLGQREHEPEPARDQRERSIAAKGDQGLADPLLPARLQVRQLGLDGSEPFHRVGHVHRQLGHQRRYPVLVDALLTRRPERHGHQRRDLVRLRLLAAGEQERTEAAADRGQDDVVDRAAQLLPDRLDLVERGAGPGVTPLLPDLPAQRGPRDRP